MQATPTQDPTTNPSSDPEELTLRDIFALMVLQSPVFGHSFESVVREQHETQARFIARKSYFLADHFLAERSRKNSQSV